MTWAQTELQAAHLGDKRLNRRLALLVEAFLERAETSIPQSLLGWAPVKAAYRFFDNDRVTPEAIIEAHAQATRSRLLGHSCILAVQDTTDLTYTHHPASTGLGYLHNQHMSGFLLHSTLAVSTEGVPLGLLGAHSWVRPWESYGKKHERRARPIEEKESYRWLAQQAASWELVPASVAVIMVADREADLYDLFAQERPAQAHWLVRAAQNRRSETEKLFTVLEAAPVAGSYTLAIGHRQQQPPRQAQLAVRYCPVTLLPPKRSLPPVPVTAILVEELAPPPGQKPICWRLLTTLELSCFEAAQTVVRYYSMRWLIERFHYVLKSGCQVEALQLKHVDRLRRAVASFSIVAWRLLQVAHWARVEPDLSCEAVFETYEWQALAAHHQGQVPGEVLSMQEALWLVAMLGGFLGRRGDGAPGVKVLWRGLRRLSDIAQTWRLAHGLSPPLVGKA